MYIYENENNFCEFKGMLNSPLSFSHESFNERFYKTELKVDRLSDASDIINVIIPKSVYPDIEELKEGAFVHLKGQFRSYNNYSNEGNRLLLLLYVRQLEILEEEENYNMIYLNGFICKPPVYRITPFGREIADVLLAVNRLHNKSDYIPCILWGKNAKSVSELNVGDNLKIEGRIQSRLYQKKTETETLTKTAYEVSVSSIL